MREAAYRKAVAALVRQGENRWRQDAQQDAIPATPTVVSSFLYEGDDVRESDYCNDVARALETLHYSPNLAAANRMFPLADPQQYDNAATLIVDMAFHVLLADVTDALFLRLGGSTGKETPDASHR